ncbi:MAG: hypothetical protein H7Y10_03385 [Flavobacterium sp.]|nr:hypothetical protein [Flavobacterium sp.]
MKTQVKTYLEFVKVYLEFVKLYAINRVSTFTAKTLSFLVRGTFKIDDIRKECSLKQLNNLN